MRFLKNTVTIDLVADQASSLRVFAAGLPRCATSSMQSALESLSIGVAPCMHFAHVAPSASRADIVLAAMRENSSTPRRHKLLRTLLYGFRAASDMPACLFADDIMDMYPDAKLVLNKRPGGGEQWEPSMRLLSFSASTSFRVVCCLWKTDRNISAVWDEMEALSMRKLGLKPEELWTAKDYDAHIAWVRAEAAKRGREVLEFEPRDGWKPLWEFLGKDAPRDQDAFPHKNDASEVKMVIRILYVRGLVSWLALGAAVYGVARWFQRS